VINVGDRPILGIETSCDETAAAVVAGSRILSNVVSSSVDFHRRFGGVVPEIAARKQTELISAVIKAALDDARHSFEDIGGIAITIGPGLIGSLVVGVAAAKAVALARNLPIVGINHLEGHIYSNFLNAEGKADFNPPSLPAVALIVSGGHSHLVLMENHGRYRILGRTRDDASGEAFDKGARLLGLGYPGGPAIDSASENGDAAAVDFPRANLGRSWDFSFSGVKTALARYVQKTPESKRPPLADLSASYQEAVVEPLARKAVAAALHCSCKTLLVCGGVAANRRLRSLVTASAEEANLDLRVPPLSLCTDNAAMMACAGHHKLAAGHRDDFSLDASASLPLKSWA